MKSPRAVLALAVLLAGGTAALWAQDKPKVSTSRSQAYPEVTCTSTDDLAIADTLQMAEETRSELQDLLKLSPHWRFPVHIRILTPTDPVTAKINREASAAFADDTSMHLEVVVPIDDPDGRAFVQRQLVTAFLWEKFFAHTQHFDSKTKLDAVPVWLIEGLREWLEDDAERDREQIVRRAVEQQHAPSLAEVTAWTEISPNRLRSLYQRAFCYYLVNSLARGPHREDFLQWLDSYSSDKPQSARNFFPTEAGWQRELVEATSRSRNIVYTWDETSAELTDAQTLAIPGDKPADTRVVTLDNVVKLPMDQKLAEAIQKKIFDLTALELRAQVSWRPIIALYRFGLQALVNEPKTDKGPKLLQQARDQQVAEIDRHQQLIDYVNWFEVTKTYSGNTTSFDSYSSTMKETDHAQADPNHPDELLNNLLQVEAQL